MCRICILWCIRMQWFGLVQKFHGSHFNCQESLQGGTGMDRVRLRCDFSAYHWPQTIRIPRNSNTTQSVKKASTKINIYIYRYVYKYQTSATPESKLSFYPTFNLAVKDFCSLDSCFEASDWEKRYEFVWALDSDIDLSKAVTCGELWEGGWFHLTDPYATGQADLHQFLEIARQMDAPIVGPTFANPLIKLKL